MAVSTNSKRATVLYCTPAAHSDEAISIADNWLSMFLNWKDPSSGEDYDIDGAVTRRTADIYDESGEHYYEVRIPISYTERTDPTLVGFIES